MSGEEGLKERIERQANKGMLALTEMAVAGLTVWQPGNSYEELIASTIAAMTAGFHSYEILREEIPAYLKRDMSEADRAAHKIEEQQDRNIFLRTIDKFDEILASYAGIGAKAVGAAATIGLIVNMNLPLTSNEQKEPELKSKERTEQTYNLKLTTNEPAVNLKTQNRYQTLENNPSLAGSVDRNVGKIINNSHNSSKLEVTLTKLSVYDSHIENVCKTNDLDEELYIAYLATVTPDARTSTEVNGRVGLAKTSARTARRHGATINQYVDERRNPLESLRIGAEHLAEKVKQFDSELYGVIAHELGDNTAKRLQRTYGNNWVGLEKALDDKIAEKVLKIFSRKEVIENDLIEFERNPIRFTTYTIKRGDNLTEIADRNDTNISNLRKYNTHIKNFNNLIPGTKIIMPVIQESALAYNN